MIYPIRPDAIWQKYKTATQQKISSDIKAGAK
jgi:hypothetical protein